MLHLSLAFVQCNRLADLKRGIDKLLCVTKDVTDITHGK